MVIINGDTGIDTIKNGTVTSSDLATSIALTGIPTATAGDNSTLLATTAFSMGSGIGSNQTWQDVASSRALGTTYTNSTGKPIMVIVSCSGSTTANLSLAINGYNFIFQNIYNSISQFGTVYGIIPNGGTYIASITTGSATNLRWGELR